MTTATTYETRKADKPFVGMPATYGIGSDCYAETIVKIERNGKTLVTMPWSIVKVIGLEEAARKVDEPHPYIDGAFAHGHRFTLRPDGRYRPQGSKSGGLSLGIAQDYRDPSF